MRFSKKRQKWTFSTASLSIRDSPLGGRGADLKLKPKLAAHTTMDVTRGLGFLGRFEVDAILGLDAFDIFADRPMVFFGFLRAHKLITFPRLVGRPDVAARLASAPVLAEGRGAGNH